VRPPRGLRQEEATYGVDVGEDGVSINGGQVFAGDGCAKAGDVVVGDCEEGKAKKGDSPSDGGSGDTGASEDAGAEPSEDQYGDEDGSEGEAGEATVLESTTSGDGGEGTRSQTTETTTESATDVVEGSGAGTEPETDPAATEAPDEGCAVEGPMGETTTTTVERVIDGDTVETPEGAVRLIGVDTPETVDPGEPVEPGGEEASGFTAAELEGEEVELEPGTEPEDDYGRTLAYLWTEDESGEPVLFNETLLREGLAELLIIPPNDEYERCLSAAEKAARDEGVGLWADDTGDAEPVPADSPPGPGISASEEPGFPPEDAATDAPAQDQYEGEGARPEDAVTGGGEPQGAAPPAAEDQYEEAASEPTPLAPDR
jgi:micrococcal nuclease